MKRKQIHTFIHLYASVLLAFTMPLARMMQLFIIILVLNWLIEADFKQKFKTLLSNRPALLLIGFYVLHLLGLLYTSNADAGAFDVQVKLSLFLFPLLFATRPLEKSQLNKVFFGFIAGALASSLFMLIYAMYAQLTTGAMNYFYEALAFYIHPSYISMYLNLILVWLLMDVNKPSSERLLKAAWSLLLLLFFLVMIVLLSSKMGIISSFLVLGTALVYSIVKHKKYVLGTVGIAVIALSVLGILKFVPEVAGRLERAVHAVTAGSDDNTKVESTAVRMLVWKASNTVISEHVLLGVGTGDSKDALMAEYERQGMTGALEHRLNCHNEFYQVFVSLGLVGFLLLLLVLFLPLAQNWKRQNFLFVFFVALVFLNFLTESMLETQAGVLFFGYFYALLSRPAKDDVLSETVTKI